MHSSGSILGNKSTDTFGNKGEDHKHKKEYSRISGMLRQDDPDSDEDNLYQSRQMSIDNPFGIKSGKTDFTAGFGESIQENPDTE